MADKGSNLIKNVTKINGISNVKNYAIQEMKLLVAGSKLNFLERGQLYADFKAKFLVSDYDMASFFGKDRSTISREIRLYLKAQEFGFDYNKKPDELTDRVLIRGLEVHSKVDFERYLNAYKKYTNLGFETFTSLINGSVSVKDVRQRITEKYKKRMNELLAYEKEFGNQKKVIEDDPNIEKVL